MLTGISGSKHCFKLFPDGLLIDRHRRVAFGRAIRQAVRFFQSEGVEILFRDAGETLMTSRRYSCRPAFV